MIKDWLVFLLCYIAISAVPALVLMARGRSWRPMFAATTFLVAWTGGGWIIMLWMAVSEKPTILPPMPEAKGRGGKRTPA